MLWSEIREWLAIILPLIPIAWLGINRLVSKSFVTTESLLAVHKVLDDRANDQEKKIINLKHENELLKKDIEGLPNFTRVNKLDDTIKSLDRHLVQSDGKIDGLTSKVDDLRESVRTLDDIVRKLA